MEKEPSLKNNKFLQKPSFIEILKTIGTILFRIGRCIVLTFSLFFDKNFSTVLLIKKLKKSESELQKLRNKKNEKFF